MKDTIISSFNKTIAKHFKRLAGTDQGINGLSINFSSLVCCVLLASREMERSAFPASPPKRYFYDSLAAAVSDFSIDAEKSLRSIIDVLIDKGYIGLGNDDAFIPMKPAIITAKLLDKIFPKMTGINFIAFTGQTIDEALSNRTDIEEAISRFDQTLYNHGKALPHNPSLHDPPKSQTTIKQLAHNVADSCPKESQDNAYDALSALKKIFQSGSRGSACFSNKAVILRGKTGVKKETNKHEPPLADVILRNENSHTDDELQQNSACGENDNLSSIANNLPGEPALTEKEPVFEEEPAVLKECSLEPLQQAQLNESEIPVFPSIPVFRCEQNEEENDEKIAERIKTFEDELALNCPLCKVFILKKMATTTGKLYYICTSETCNFISWGRPHHTVCKRCGNPFLIEAEDKTEGTLLKCPRATCRHRQSAPPPKVKVVKKRLVRKRN